MPEPTSTSEISSPLTVDKTDTISELFARDPLNWTDADIDRMVAHYREQRHTFMTKPKKEPTAPKVDKAQLEGLDGEDLLSKLGL